MSKLKYLVLIMLLVTYSCATDDTSEPQEEVQETEEMIEVEPEPVVEEPVVEETPITEATDVPEVEPFDDQLIKDAKKLIFKAEEARASTYFPQRLADIKSLLSKVTQNKDSDPDLARELLAQFNTEANDLIDDSWLALKTACIDILNNKTKMLLKIKADKYTPKEFKVTQDNKDTALASFEADDFTKSLADYRIAYTSLTNLYNDLSENMNHIQRILKILRGLRADGKALNSEKWAPVEYAMAIESYGKAKNYLYKDYNATLGEESLRETLYYARKTIEQTKINIKVSETDSDIFDLMSELEDASTLTVLDSEDNIIEPEAWEGEVDLTEKPIEAEVDKDDKSGLKEIDLEKDVEVDYPEVSFNIIPGETQVLGVTEKRKNLLDEAKELWAKGVEARNSGDLQTANEYLSKAKVYLDEYKSMAVDYIYTVQLNLERRDCLWRIAEKDEFYGDPFKWQHIWERNKKLIQDPDLIYPGWQLIIPPLD